MADISINARSSIRIAGSKIIYFDPFKITKEDHDADIIFVTHEHYDHFSPEDIKKICGEDTILVAPYSMKQIVLEELDGVIRRMEFVKSEAVEEERFIGNILIKWVPAYNVNKPFHVKENAWVGYVITLDSVTYFVTGDTDANENNRNVTCDVLLVPCGGKYTFDVREAAEFTYKIKPEKVIPTHYTDVAGKSEIGEMFMNEVRKQMPDMDVVILI